MRRTNLKNKVIGALVATSALIGLGGVAAPAAHANTAPDVLACFNDGGGAYAHPAAGYRAVFWEQKPGGSWVRTGNEVTTSSGGCVRLVGAHRGYLYTAHAYYAVKGQTHAEGWTNQDRTGSTGTLHLTGVVRDVA